MIPRSEILLEKIEECLRAYGEREEGPIREMPFNRGFRSMDSHISVTIDPIRDGWGFDLLVKVRVYPVKK